eukprot:CAMPEP_0119020940 /NCGR_PEP_ID=MMETSP1176-20130426/25032_1 /TAXON_ID=265551 /ORGANISM="Synedropsis recta cf, Strain CCMP1620" /LENGTH=104 /DNA_ID=CAMNT_0006975449 /DNA_START=111 /DNA_END=425 /DNA_ORIENTATION=-
MTSDRTVRFPEEPVASTHTYIGITADAVSSLFYNVEDYRRFRTERAQEDMERIKAALRKQTLCFNKQSRPTASRRDSLTGLSRSGRRNVPYQQSTGQKGIALAA